MARPIGKPPFMVGPQLMKDPNDNKGAIWVTIELSVAMKSTYSDVELMEFVVQQIRNRKASVWSSAQHYRRYLCLALPVNEYITGKKDEDAVMAKGLEAGTLVALENPRKKGSS
ncbi:hypothetical protein N7472_008329 [Penicillium cf. griseofulvum]|uniref:Uncharacterized protein n=1 Tax=Penicillium cf. griseofulvum TaxID=2972120 RepID=A0A9W9J6Q9_9EURO|nr:hypothetical protein N7472_008329 [Penicillium cf. griseofulvum]KAJ5452882.1 hypothetical protein N7445_001065 [Penicillium cf. griseofulvum]